jgi:hypothetical protein
MDPLLGNDHEKTRRKRPLLGSGPRATMEVLLEAVFYMQFALRPYDSTDRVQLVIAVQSVELVSGVERVGW